MLFNYIKVKYLEREIMCVWVSKMGQWVKFFVNKLGNLSFIFGLYLRGLDVERQIFFNIWFFDLYVLWCVSVVCVCEQGGK